MDHSELAEVCIIGGGVAGAVVASELASAGIKVLILEAGPRHDPAKRFEYMRQSLYGGDPWGSDNPERDRFTLDGPYRSYNLNQRRVKAVGGSGLHWGGHVGRLHESDFELLSRYHIATDWPIRYDDLESYYLRAEKLIGVAGADAYPLTPRRSGAYPMPPFPFSYSDNLIKPAFDQLRIPLHHAAIARNSTAYDKRPPCMSFAMCKTCPVLAKWTPDLLLAKAEKTGQVVVKTHTRVTHVNLNQPSRKVESITALSVINGKPIEVKHRAEIFVIAAQTVESTRLLLLSGLGSRLPTIGKYLIELKERTFPERIGFDTAESCYFYEHSRDQGGTAFVLGPANRDVQTPLDIVNEELSKGLIWGDELKTVVQRRFGSGVVIAAMIEQLPYTENHISLDNSVRDDLGFPAPRLTYFLSHKRELQTIETVSAIIRKLLEALHATNIRMQTGLAPGHPLGTTRMGDDPKLSVVDRDLKIHGIDNLYTVGGSVFPTSGAVAPTLTIAALALRLRDHVHSKLRHTNVINGASIG
jgi:choline dehydrogenase-like flavoprotein